MLMVEHGCSKSEARRRLWGHQMPKKGQKGSDPFANATVVTAESRAAADSGESENVDPSALAQAGFGEDGTEEGGVKPGVVSHARNKLVVCAPGVGLREFNQVMVMLVLVLVLLFVLLFVLTLSCCR